MKNAKLNFLLFGIGGTLYGIIELLWRGRTHWSMFSAGGLCFLSFSEISNKIKKSGLFFKALIGSAVITSIEFVFGVVFNIILKKNVWDYSRMPFNICGQVCALYSFLWFLLSLIGIPFAHFCNKRLQNRILMV